MDLGATKHMTLNRAAFITCEAIPPCNVHLGDDSVAEAIRMRTIIVGIEKRGIRNRGCITYGFHILKLQANLFSISKFFVERVEGVIVCK